MVQFFSTFHLPVFVAQNHDWPARFRRCANLCGWECYAVEICFMSILLFSTLSTLFFLLPPPFPFSSLLFTSLLFWFCLLLLLIPLSCCPLSVHLKKPHHLTVQSRQAGKGGSYPS